MGCLGFALLLTSLPAAGAPPPFVLLSEAVTLPRQFTTAAVCSVIKRKSWGTFHYYYYYYFAQRLSKRDNLVCANEQQHRAASQAVLLALTATAARTQPSDQPVSPNLWLWQSKRAFYCCDSQLEDTVYSWMLIVMVFSTNACVGTQAPASDTSLSISDNSWLHSLALQNHLPAQEEAVTCIIFALQSKHTLDFLWFFSLSKKTKGMWWAGK